MEVLAIAKQNNDVLINEQINLPEVMVIGPNGEQLGVKSKEEAMTLASYAGFDLVLINEKGDTPVKGVDYFTAEDRYQIVQDVLAALPTTEGVGY